ncbi:hypothetical protein MMC29_007607 [Sticta canariensis]|nr:hypothetical protein [Sticta canariensis]
MATPENGSMNDMAPETKPIANEGASYINEAPKMKILPRRANQTLMRGPRIMILLSTTLEVASTTNVGSTRAGLHSLPTEIRVLIFQLTFLEHLPADLLLSDTFYIPFSLVLNASIQLRRALQASCKEDIFYVGYLHPRLFEVPYELLSESILSLQFNVRLDDKNPATSDKLNFISLILRFGRPDIIRGTLSIIFHVYPNDKRIAWFTRVLGRFTNFRTVHFEVLHSKRSADSRCPELVSEHEEILMTYFGPPRIVNRGYGMVSHLQRQANSLPPVVEVDWIDFLTGIRAIFGHDPPMELIEAESSCQNSAFEDPSSDPEEADQNLTS